MHPCCRSAAVLSLILAVSVTLLAGEKPKKAKAIKQPEPAEAKTLRFLEQCLDLGVFDPEEDEPELKLMMKSGAKAYRPWAAAVLARYERELRGDHARALNTLAEFLVGKDKAKAWHKAHEEGRKQALKKWKEACSQARKEKQDLPEKPDGSFAVFPQPSTWNIKEHRQRCAIEAGRVFLALGRTLDALAAFKAVADRNEESLGGILGTEGGGDAHMQPGKYEKAVGFYEHALSLSKRCISYLHTDPYGEIAYHKKRIEKKLAQAKRLRDIERYGEGFVLYREAEEQRRSKKDFGAAYLKFLLLEEKFPGTVYSEAGKAYRVKCLLALSNAQHSKKREKLIRYTEAKLKSRREELKQLKKDKASRLRIRMFENEVAYYEKELKKLTSVPLGAFALKSAEQLAKTLQKARRFGLYRGEVLCDLAHHAFHQKLDPKLSETRYTRAWEWLSAVAKADADLAAFRVPAKAKKVSSPPAREFKTDAFGNIENTDVRVGAVVNRTTCPWYLDDLREKCALAIGFLCFYKGEKRQAIRWYEKAVKLDQKTALLQKKGEWNNYKRLRWGAEKGFLYAQPKELELYKGRQRFVLLVGDFYYCTERFARAKVLAERMLAGEFGALDAKKRDYPRYAIASTLAWEGKRSEAFAAYEKVLETKDNTYTEYRAVFSAGNLAWYIPNKEIQKRGREYLAWLAHSKKKNEYVYQARLVYGFRLVQMGQVTAGEKMLRSVPDEAGGFKQMADYYLANLDKWRQAAKKNKERVAK